MRTAKIQRETAETKIALTLALDGRGAGEIDSGVGFLNHMLELFKNHGQFDLTLRCAGDTAVDDHHSVEDIGICLGQAFSEALQNRRGICRYAHIILPMDEALILCAVDVSGRGMLRMDMPFPTEKIGAFDTQLVEEFFAAFARVSGITIHIKKLDGTNAHHIAEGAFKAFARALKAACAIDPARAGEIPSTKGVL